MPVSSGDAAPGLTVCVRRPRRRQRLDCNLRRSRDTRRFPAHCCVFLSYHTLDSISASHSLLASAHSFLQPRRRPLFLRSTVTILIATILATAGSVVETLSALDLSNTHSFSGFLSLYRRLSLDLLGRDKGCGITHCVRTRPRPGHQLSNVSRFTRRKSCPVTALPHLHSTPTTSKSTSAGQAQANTRQTLKKPLTCAKASTS